MRLWWFAISFLSMPALAQESPKTESARSAVPSRSGTADPIVVTRQKAPDPAVVRDLVHAITPVVPFEDPLPRFDAPVCFATIGLDRPTLEQIGDRLAENAQLAGLRLAGTKCKPNVAILFVNDVDNAVKTLLERRWWLFGDRVPAEIRTITRETGPVRAWSNSEVRSPEGMPRGEGALAKNLPVNEGVVLTSPFASRITSPVQRDMLVSIVLVERSAVIGKTTTQVADYLAMRTLAVVRPNHAHGRETILTLFDAGMTNPAEELTAFDRGYLKGLYAGNANQYAALKIGKITHAILDGAAPRPLATSGQTQP